MKPLIISHAHCTDGFGASFAAWKKFGDEAEYLFANYGNEKSWLSPDGWLGRDVYVIDFSLPRNQMDDLFTHAKKVVWLDHHKTAFEMYGKLPNRLGDRPLYEVDLGIGATSFVVLDNNKSGALLAWEYFHPGTEVPTLIKHIDDRDRWQFKLEGSKEIHAALASYKPWSFEQWAEFAMLSADEWVPQGFTDYDLFMSKGEAILRAHEQNVQSIVGAGRREVLVLLPDVDLGVEDSCDNCTKSNFGTTRCPSSACPGWFPKLEEGQFVGIGRRLIQSGRTFQGLSANCPPYAASDVGHELANQSGTFGLCWYMGRDGKAKVSLRSNGQYDVSAIAKAFGGGGHLNASGMEVSMETLMGWLK